MRKTLTLALLSSLSTAAAQQAPQLCQNAINQGLRYTQEKYLIAAEDLRTDYRISGSTLRQLGELRATLAKNGVTLIPLVLPLRGMIYPGTLTGYTPSAGKAEYDQFISDLRSQGFTVPNLLAYAQANAAGKQLFRKLDGHLIGNGAHIMAQGFAAGIKQSNVLAGIPNVQFTTTPSQAGVSTDNAFSAQVASLCDTKDNFGPDNWEIYTTQPVNEVGLTDDVAAPQVTLVGTSQSSETINLAGELKTVLSVDLTNEQISGGGVYASLMNYLHSKDFATQKPKVIIWEYSMAEAFLNRPDAPKFDDKRALNQMIAAANGPCVNPVWQKTGAVVQWPKLSGRNYIMITSSNEAQRTLTVKADRNIQSLTLPNRLTHTGTWYYLLSTNPSGVARLEADSGTTLTASICPVH